MININLVNRLKDTMALFGRSITEFDVTQKENPVFEMELLLYKFLLSKSDEDVLSEIVSMKKEMDKKVYEVPFCPFERLTKVSWEEMFNRAFVPKLEGYENGIKPVSQWMHFVTSSKYYPFKKTNKRQSAIFEFREIGEEYIKIRGNNYVCGEAAIFTNKIPINSDPPSSIPIWTYNPTIVLDEKLIKYLVIQPEWSEILELIYALYHVSSHSNTLHHIYMESDEELRKNIIFEDPVMKKFLTYHYHIYDTYEINYCRMTRVMFDLMNEYNPTLREDVKLIHSRIYELSKDWPFILKEYIRFMATERMARILCMLPRFSHVERYLKTPIISPINITNDRYLYEIIHSHKEKGAIVHNGYRRNVESVSWEAMTKFILDSYPVR